MGSRAIHRLSIGDAFNTLSSREKLYAHFMAKAAWSGTRIILRQVSPESPSIFDFIIEVENSCQTLYQGNWETFGDAREVGRSEVEAFLHYAATFLSNIGNYYVRL